MYFNFWSIVLLHMKIVLKSVIELNVCSGVNQKKEGKPVLTSRMDGCWPVDTPNKRSCRLYSCYFHCLDWFCRESQCYITRLQSPVPNRFWPPFETPAPHLLPLWHWSRSMGYCFYSDTSPGLVWSTPDNKFNRKLEKI